MSVVSRRKTHDEVLAAAKAVLLVLRLCEERAGLSESSIWSQTTLAATQGWPFEDRVLVFSHALANDKRTDMYHEPIEQNLYRNEQRLLAVLAQHGDDGGLDK